MWVHFMCYEIGPCLSILYTECVYVNPKLIMFIAPFPFSNIKFVFHICESISVLWISSFVSPFFWIIRVAPAAYGNSWARGQSRATASGLPHSHRNMGSKPCLWPIPQFRACWIHNPLNKAIDWTHILMHTIWINFPVSQVGLSVYFFSDTRYKKYYICLCLSGLLHLVW